MNTNLQILLERLLAFRDERDWARFQTPKNLALSISLEAAELLEHFQWTTGKGKILFTRRCCQQTPKTNKKCSTKSVEILHPFGFVQPTLHSVGQQSISH